MVNPIIEMAPRCSRNLRDALRRSQHAWGRPGKARVGRTRPSTPLRAGSVYPGCDLAFDVTAYVARAPPPASSHHLIAQRNSNSNPGTRNGEGHDFRRVTGSREGQGFTRAVERGKRSQLQPLRRVMKPPQHLLIDLGVAHSTGTASFSPVITD